MADQTRPERPTLQNAAVLVDTGGPSPFRLPNGFYTRHREVVVTHFAVAALSKEAAATVNELDPGWMRQHNVLWLGREAESLPAEPPALAGPLAWPLLDAEGLATYLERYTPIKLGDAIDHSSHVAWLGAKAPVEPPPPPAGSEIVRVLRLIEYVGPRDAVEAQVRGSLHGTRGGMLSKGAEGFASARRPERVEITAVTLHEYPEVLERGRTPLQGLTEEPPPPEPSPVHAKPPEPPEDPNA